MRKIFFILYGIFICLSFLKCKNEHKKLPTASTTDQPLIFYRSGRYFINEVRDSVGRLIMKQRYNQDTVADGAAITYYSNGKIKNWKWYNNNNIPDCGLYYDTTGKFYGFRGDPFIKGIRHLKDSSFEIEMVNPPNVQYTTTLEEFYKNKPLSCFCYDPAITDSCSWICIGAHNDYKYKKGHIYILSFYVIDSNYKILSGAETAMEIFPDRYVSIKASPNIHGKIAKEQ